MPTFKHGDVSLYYGGGMAAAIRCCSCAPGGMRSVSSSGARVLSIRPREFASDFRVIAMDQPQRRQSSAPITAQSTAGKLTPLIISRYSIISDQAMPRDGRSIGSSYCLGLIKAAPERVSAAVLQNPIGLSPRNREMVLRDVRRMGGSLKWRGPSWDAAGLREFRDRSYGTDFVFKRIARVRAPRANADADSMRQRRLSSDSDFEGDRRPGA